MLGGFGLVADLGDRLKDGKDNGSRLKDLGFGRWGRSGEVETLVTVGFIDEEVFAALEDSVF